MIDKTGLHKDHYTGAVSELVAQQWYLARGCQVYVPVVQQGWVDFVVDDPIKGLLKVQVKTATWTKSGNYHYLQCRTRLTNKYQAVLPEDMYDVLVIIHSDRLWEIPADEITSSNLSLDTTNKNSRSDFRWSKYEY